jgi:NADH dehydrogenase
MRHVVVVGGGFGGLETVFCLSEAMKDARLTLVEKSGLHSFLPSIHEIIAGRVTTRDISIPLDVILPGQARLVKDEVTAIDTAARRIVCRHEALDFDYLIVAVGAENNFYGVKGAEDHALRFRRPGDAERIRTDLVAMLRDRDRNLRIIVGGGGTEGVEVAGELVDAVKAAGRSGDLLSGAVAIELIHNQERLLPAFPDEAGERAAEYLSSLGVMISARERISEVRQGSLLLESGRERPLSMLIWTGGIRPPRLIREMALVKDPGGWLEVNGHLHAPNDDRVFGLGDLVSVKKDGEYLNLPRLAYHAMDQAVVVSKNVANRIEGLPLVSYSPKHRPQLVSIGKDMGLLVQGEKVLQGAWVVTLKKTIQARHLMSCLSRPVYSAVMKRVRAAGYINIFRRLVGF